MNDEEILEQMENWGVGVTIQGRFYKDGSKEFFVVGGRKSNMSSMSRNLEGFDSGKEATEWAVANEQALREEFATDPADPKTLYYMCVPQNTNVRAGDDVPADFRIEQAPTADYYESLEEAVAACDAYNTKHDLGFETAACVFKLVHWLTDGEGTITKD